MTMVKYRYLLEQDFGISGFRELCMVTFPSAIAPLSVHVHPDAMEICFLYRGRQTYEVAGEPFHMKGMDIFLTYPNEPHGSGPQPEEKSHLYYMIVDTVNHLDQFLGFPHGEAKWVAEQLNALPKRLFFGSERIRVYWNELARLTESAHPLKTALMRSHALLLLHEVLHCSMAGGANISGDIQSALTFISENLENWLPIPLLAEHAGLSCARFKTKFRAQVGMPPGEYVLREKIRRAEALLSSGHSVTFVAHQLSFSSSQHLSTVYKKYTGRSPRRS